MLEQGSWKKEAPHASKEFHARLEEKLMEIDGMDAKKVDITEYKGKRQTSMPSGKKSAFKKAVMACGGLVAAGAIFMGVCYSNPVWASELPLIGGIFSDMADKLSYGEDYEKYVEPVVPGKTETASTEASSETGETAQTDQPEAGSAEESTGADGEMNGYTQTVNGTSVTLSESYCSGSALYLSMTIKSETPFADTSRDMRNLPILSVRTEETYSFMEGMQPGLIYLEGDFVDPNTYEGVMRIDLLEKTGNIADGIEGEESIDIPDSFELKLSIPQIIGDLADQDVFDTGYSEEELENMSDEEWKKVMDEAAAKDPTWDEYPNAHINWWIDGPFDFDLNVNIDETQTQTVEVNQFDADGTGIKEVKKTPFELTVVENYGTEDGMATYFPVILDANGTYMESESGGVVNTVPIRGYDISTVYIYMCDYDEYMDELKGVRFSDPEGFQALMEEKALIKAEVHF
ncbi:MAG: DUF4179 domain-containing protein [Clostridia bacterium]|nr:DUF4179 domain-containing protein [Clostridia bacterium]